MKIAIMGFRGIPANYGGFETFVEKTAPLLVAKGHEVTVYGRSNIITYKEPMYKGVKLVILPTISHKYLDTPVHTFFSVIHSLRSRHDIVLMLNAVNSPFAFMLRIAGKKVVLNVDGIERMRKKWNRLGKLFYRIGEFCATLFPNEIVSDAGVIRDYYLEEYGKASTMIAYGADIEKVDTRDVLEKYRLEAREYFLYVSRLEPENNAYVVIKAFRQLETGKKLVLVGDAPYSESYKKELMKLASEDDRIILTGYVFGKGYREFQANAFCYIQATEVGGTHPALLEGMALCGCVIANDTPENREVLSDAGFLYKKNCVNDLRDKMSLLLDDPALAEPCRIRARTRIQEKYSWDSVAAKYEDLFCKTIKRGRR